MKKSIFLLPLAFVLAAFTVNAQVNFKMSYDKETERYIVSLIPMTTYTNPQNITGSGQVTIKVPTNEFDPVDIENLLTGMTWEANSRNNAPAEAPDFDYVSFGLTIQAGTAYPDYQAGVEMPLFSFQNAFGCTGKVYLVDNVNDPFMPPNSQSANIGNTWTILGAGGEAYQGIIGSGENNCAETASSAVEEIVINAYKVFPNPASQFVNVEMRWENDAADAQLQVVDAAGKKVITQDMTVTYGQNRQKLDVSNLAAGNYWVYLEGEGWKAKLDKFSKQ
ncbi:MAG: T9SS type A sorting domain-containing protein [Saprospiraceae bacterium]